MKKKQKKMYEKFWNMNPGILNPTDINSEEKHNFCKTLTYEELSLMQRARKQAYPFTRL